ncbi:Fatty acyl-CoA synthetase and RNA processing-associated kinase 1 [Smittium culicis]|uniref:Fatty acyl-CoA synthetase and RNA processing-associated kinase 1 n=1 Tax=Smittium culicis TaxID=133412 RepID=A0A1R1YNJ7_9FUNG|nr:Fatty acyl-CoA synthetase and RNA processing-associated kinase 1 [Smittium culicis]
MPKSANLANSRHNALESNKKSKSNFFGNYMLLHTIGEGEFAKVKLALHRDTGEEGIDHRYIVKLHDIIETEKYIGLVLEYASGGELFEHILAHRYLRERDACRLFAQLISAVSCLHQNKIVHRDLKLENLLLDWHRNIKVTDFGFANQFDPENGEYMSTSCGSPCYAAPEVVVSDGMYAGTSVDVWSCGVILYAMLAGYLPFDDDPSNPEGDNINQLYKYILSTQLNFPDHISQSASSLLKRMLVSNPAQRATMAEIRSHEWLEPYSHFFKDIEAEESHKISISDLPNLPKAESSSSQASDISRSQKTTSPHTFSITVDENQNQIVPQTDLILSPNTYFKLPNFTDPNIHLSKYNEVTESSLVASHIVAPISKPNNSLIRNASFDDFNNYKKSISNHHPDKITNSLTPKNTTHTNSKKIEPTKNSIHFVTVAPQLKSFSEPISYLSPPHLSTLTDSSDNQDFGELMKIILRKKDTYNNENNKPNPGLTKNKSFDSVNSHLSTKPKSRKSDSNLANSHCMNSSRDFFNQKNDLFGPDLNLNLLTGSKPVPSVNYHDSQSKKDLPSKLIENKDIQRPEKLFSKTQFDSHFDSPNSSRAHITSNEANSSRAETGDAKPPLLGPSAESSPNNNRIPKSLNDSYIQKVSSNQRLIPSQKIDDLRLNIPPFNDGLSSDLKKDTFDNLGVKIGAGIASQPIKPRNGSSRNPGISGKRVLNWVTGQSKKNNRSSLKSSEIFSANPFTQNHNLSQNITKADGNSSLSASEKYFQRNDYYTSNLSAFASNDPYSSRINNPEVQKFITEGPQILLQMRTHRGAIDPLCISSMPPSELFQRVLQTLDNLGFIVISTQGLSARVLRPKISDKSLLKPIVIGATYQFNLPSDSKATINEKNNVFKYKLGSSAKLSSNISESSFVIYDSPPLSNNSQHTPKETETTGNPTDSPYVIIPSIIKTKATPVAPSHATTPVDGSSLDRGIHGGFTPSNKNKNENQLLFNFSDKFKLLKRALTKSGSKNSSSKNTLQLDSLDYTQSYDINPDAEMKMLSTNYFTNGSPLLSNTKEITPISNNNIISSKSPDSEDIVTTPINKYVPSKCAPVPPPYGQSHLDSNGEVQFNVEVCKLKNLSHLFVVVLSRRKGSAWSYKYLYHLFIENLGLKKYDVYIDNPYASIIVPLSNVTVSPNIPAIHSSHQFNGISKNPNSININSYIPTQETNLSSSSYPVITNN